MPKIIREYTFEGPEDWLRVVMAKSLPDGDNLGFVSFTKDKKISVKTTYSDIRKDK